MSIYLVTKVPSEDRDKWWVIKRDPHPERRDEFIVIETFSRRRDAEEQAEQLNRGDDAE